MSIYRAVRCCPNNIWMSIYRAVRCCPNNIWKSICRAVRCCPNNIWMSIYRAVRCCPNNIQLPWKQIYRHRNIWDKRSQIYSHLICITIVASFVESPIYIVCYFINNEYSTLMTSTETFANLTVIITRVIILINKKGALTNTIKL